MRFSGLYLAAALVLTVVAGCSETKTPETTDETGEPAPTPDQPIVDRVPLPSNVIPRPAAINPIRPRQVEPSRPTSVHELEKSDLEARIAKLSIYRGGDTSTPELGLGHFLEALKRRDAVAAEELLTSVARIEALLSNSNIRLAEQSTFTERTRFKIGKPEFIDETKTGAHIPVLTTTYDEEGEYTEEIIWVVGRDDYGWRVAGYAIELFKNEPWLVLNFQDLAEVRQKTQMAEAEMKRRADEQALEARRQPNPGGNPSPPPQR